MYGRPQRAARTPGTTLTNMTNIKKLMEAFGMKGTRQVPTVLLFLMMLVFHGVASGQTLDLDRVVAKLEPEIDRMMLEGKIPSATIALVAGDKVVWTGAYGYSNLWARTPAVPSTVYLIGSTFKAMSTVALLQLMEKGKFKLDDRVNDYLTEFKIRGEHPSNPITLRHLLTHTSGLPGGLKTTPVWGDTLPPTLPEHLRNVLEVKRPPLEKVEYSNPAFALVGYLVEKLSGVPYKEYMQKYVFDPLEMRSTVFDPNPEVEERLAVPYAVDEKTGHHVPVNRVRASEWPAGIVYGTVLDQANWLIANLNGGLFKEKRVISAETLAQMHTRQYEKFTGPMGYGWGNESTGYGLTWITSKRGGEQYFAHSGSLAGYTAFLQGNLNRKLGFAILTNGNRAHAHISKLADRAIDLLAAHSKPPGTQQ